MQAAMMMDNRTQGIRERLLGYQKNGGKYRTVEQGTGISRTAISQLANHGVTLPDGKLTKIEQFLEVNGFAGGEQVRMEEALEVSTAPISMEDLATSAAFAAGRGMKAPAPYRTDVGIYPTDDYKQSMGWCAYIFRHRKIGTLVGYPGSGKTTILKAYCKANPAAHYIECWSSMRMGDLLDMIGEAAGVALKGSAFRRQQQLVEALKDRRDFMILLDEAEYLRKWNVEKLDCLRKIWDNTGTPIVLCGTPELVNVLTRGSGKDNCAQLYRRILEAKMLGISAKEAQAMLGDYNVDPDAAGELVRIAMDKKHGGIGNMIEILGIALEAAEGGQVDRQLIEDEKLYKLMY